MLLQAGSHLGPYEILAPLGAGGMGEVYRARDTKLNRDVAIKVLLPAVANDPDHLARFSREGQVLASLNHPYIGAIYGLEDADGIRALVLELVEGPTLADRLEHGPLGLRDALAVASRIADAVSAAHEHGVIHRDLKPANIKISADGRIKILDFGLAKNVRVMAGGSNEMNPTMALHATMEGVVLGTAAYMSPEQARGQEVDRRADIWAFGCILFELLTGRGTFRGPTLSDTFAAILDREPAWEHLPAATPPAIARLLHRCVEKDARRRLHDIADARIEIDDALAAPSVPTAPGAADGRRSITLATFAVSTVAVVAAAGLAWTIKSAQGGPAVSTTAIRVSVATAQALAEADGACGTSACAGDLVLTLSPDAKRIVYAAGRGADRRLYERALDRFETLPIAGTEGGLSPVFSPDGRSIAFVADHKLKRVPLEGGTPIVLRELPTGGDGVSWSDDGTILFAPGPGTGIWRIPENGGQAEPVTTLTGTDRQHRMPEALPGGKTILFSAIGGLSNEEIVAHSLATSGRKMIVRGTSPHFLAGGRLAYVWDNTLFVAPFDPVRLELTGPGARVLQGIWRDFIGSPQFGVSRSGTVAFVPTTGTPQSTSIVWADRAGAETPLGVEDQDYIQPRLSPDGQHVAVIIGINTEDLWTYELDRRTWSRLTTDERSAFPVWAADSRHIAFASARTGNYNIYTKPTDGSGQESRLLASDRANFPTSWSPDGRTLAFVQVDPETAMDIWTVPMASSPKAEPFVRTKFREGAPVYSPDGLWMVYVSNETGREEIYVRALRGHGERWTISRDGGNEPIWTRDGKQIVYRSGDAFVAVPVKTSPTFSAGTPERLFERAFERSQAYWPNYDVTADGRRFLVIKRTSRAPLPQQINIVLNGLAPGQSESR